jgi:hypothetical protein
MLTLEVDLAAICIRKFSGPFSMEFDDVRMQSRAIYSWCIYARILRMQSRAIYTWCIYARILRMQSRAIYTWCIYARICMKVNTIVPKGQNCKRRL